MREKKIYNKTEAQHNKRQIRPKLSMLNSFLDEKRNSWTITNKTLRYLLLIHFFSSFFLSFPLAYNQTVGGVSRTTVTASFSSRKIKTSKIKTINDTKKKIKISRTSNCFEIAISFSLHCSADGEERKKICIFMSSTASVTRDKRFLLLFAEALATEMGKKKNNFLLNEK